MAFKNGYGNIFNVLFQMSWQLSKFVILKYILCYHIHLLYTLSNTWLICENKYVCHPADSCSLAWRRLRWRKDQQKPLAAGNKGPKTSIFFSTRGFVQGSGFVSPWDGRHLSHKFHRPTRTKQGRCLILEAWEQFLKAFMPASIHSSLHLVKECLLNTYCVTHGRCCEE